MKSWTSFGASVCRGHALSQKLDFNAQHSCSNFQDNEVDLKLLAKGLSAESEVREVGDVKWQCISSFQNEGHNPPPPPRKLLRCLTVDFVWFWFSGGHSMVLGHALYRSDIGAFDRVGEERSSVWGGEGGSCVDRALHRFWMTDSPLFLNRKLELREGLTKTTSVLCTVLEVRLSCFARDETVTFLWLVSRSCSRSWQCWFRPIVAEPVFRQDSFICTKDLCVKCLQ